MRRSLFWHLAGAIGRGEFGRLAFAAMRAGAARADLDLAEDWRGPLLATFALTWRCPLACAMCDLPARAGAEIADADVPSWIDALSALRPAGLGFTGGEPLLRKAVLFEAIERIARRGIVAHLNTSGVGLGENDAARLAASGLGSVNVSVDHPDATENDRLRGRTGATARALDAVERLAAARAANGASFRLQVMMAVDAASLPLVPRLRALALDRGADDLSLLPVHDFAAPSNPRSPSHAVRDPHAGEPAARSAAESPALAGRLENSAEYLARIPAFLAGARMPGTCSAPRTAVFVDPTGDLYCCTPGATLGRGGVKATPDTLASLVRGYAQASTAPHDFCDRCWWNCHRELDIAIGARRIGGP